MVLRLGSCYDRARIPVLYDQSSTAVRGGVKDRIPRLVVTYYPRKNIHTESRVSCNARGRGI